MPNYWHITKGASLNYGHITKGASLIAALSAGKHTWRSFGRHGCNTSELFLIERISAEPRAVPGPVTVGSAALAQPAAKDPRSV